MVLGNSGAITIILEGADVIFRCYISNKILGGRNVLVM